MKYDNDPRFLPQVILAGAPKCGTTSIFDHLQDHPDICASSEKETYYLIDKKYPLYREAANFLGGGWAGYSKFFEHCSSGSHGLRFEATPDYLYQRTPLEVIPQWPITPKIFFVLRRPEARVLSLFRFAQNNLGTLSKDISFSQFLQQQGREDGLFRNRPILNNAIAHSKYVDYLLEWRQAIGSNNIRVFLMEHFQENPQQFMENIANFLALDSSFYENYDFQVKNRSYNVKYQRLHLWKKALSPYIKSEKARNFLGKLYRTSNLSSLPGTSAEDLEELSQLAIKFRESNCRLEEEFEVDLSSWHDPN